MLNFLFDRSPILLPVLVDVVSRILNGRREALSKKIMGHEGVQHHGHFSPEAAVVAEAEIVLTASVGAAGTTPYWLSCARTYCASEASAATSFWYTTRSSLLSSTLSLRSFCNITIVILSLFNLS